jgi:hypothetical protein
MRRQCVKRWLVTGVVSSDQAHTKSSLLLDFWKGAQSVPPVCVGVLLGFNGQSPIKQTSLHTAETALFFCAQKVQFQGDNGIRCETQ